MRDGSLTAVKYCPALDGIRGIAILAVLAVHCNMLLARPIPAFSIGWMGVDLFFVLSGYLITTILLETVDLAGYFRVFYSRRALRILPLYYGACLVLFVGLEHTHFRGTVGYETLRSNELWYWLYGVNWLIALKGWLAAPIYTSHLWSLAIEEQFYLVWPLVVMLSGRRGVSRIAVVLVTFSFALRLLLVLRHVRPETIFVSTPTHLDGLVIGAWLAANRLRAWRRIVWLGVGAAAAYAAIALFRGTANPYDPVVQVPSYTLVGLASAGLLAYGARSSAHWLAWRPLTQLGRVSYGLYVIHFPVVGVLMQRWPQGGWPAIGVAVSASLALAALSWVCLERPILSLKRYVPYGTRQAIRVHA